MKNTLGFVVLTLCMTTNWLSAQTLSKPAHQEDSPQTQKKNVNIESFDMVWQTIKDSHWQSEKVGESWDQHKKELYPKVVAAQTKAESREIMNDLIRRLEQSHFGIIPSDSYSLLEDENFEAGDCDIGITVRLVNDQLVVTAVRENSSSAQQGVKPGWAIKKIRDRDAAEFVQKIKQIDQGPQRADTTIGLAMQSYCSGRLGTKLELEFTDENNQLKSLALECTETPGKYAKFGNLPPIKLVDQTKTLPGNIGYYHFNAFFDPIRIMPAYRKVIQAPEHSSGIVIDLRGNIGGIAAMTMGMAGAFVTEKQTLGTLTMKGTELDFIANPQAIPYTAPVAVLVDECSISSAEIFAGGLQDLGLAKIFGNKTAGLALPSTVIKLPNGDGFQYAFADYHSASGKSLEINGVVPDVEVKLTKQNLGKDGDPALRAAINWIQSKKS